ncbi:hypothetical protein KFE25_007839 [Diacronema lutheri]|uniref:Nucleotide-diphospho-sugar transferase domain-containing protein n=2 Tax=Diacronema lutheri TaxID=2081491 RepID=A0A8J5XUP3_DIALT|nr:hypothetical protein KFE25_007839 [Diacronema lutheri]
MPPQRGAAGGGTCSRSGPRLALLVVFVVYCVIVVQNSGQNGPQAPRLVPATPHGLRAAHVHAGMAALDAARPASLGGGGDGSGGVPAPRVPAAAATAAAAGGDTGFCTGPFLANTAQPIVTDESMLAEEPPLAPGDVASVHVPPLTRSFCERYAKGKALITTAADQRYMTWARNWAKSLQAHGVTNLFIGAMDADALRLSHAEGIPSVLLGRMRAGTTWHSANRYKIRLVQGVVELGFDVLFTDADVTFVRDPMPFLLSYPEAGVLISTDLLVREKPYPMVNGLENTYETVGQYRADLNVGLMFVRSTAHTVRMMNHWADVANADMSKSMQTFFVKLVREYAACLPPDPKLPHLAPCYNGTVNIGLLPMDRFCGGYIYFVERLPQRMGIEAISTHATYQVHQGLDGKRERLRHAHLWYLDGAEYYAPAGGVLSMAPMALPAWMADEALVRRYGEGGDLRDAHKNRTLMHFELVHFQLRQLRNALALGAMLGRTLVMPDFTVLLDNTWYPMNGAWPGFRKLGPFVAPLDHVLHMTQLQNNNVAYRGSTFLDHPCIRDGYATAQRLAVAFEPGAPAPTAEQARTASRVVLPKGATQAQVVAALQHHPAKVIHLESTLDIISGFDDPAEQERFASRINRTPMLWCCITKNVANDMFQQPFPPGHIYYDFWYDRPHTDRFGRRHTDTWQLRVGP